MCTPRVRCVNTVVGVAQFACQGQVIHSLLSAHYEVKACRSQTRRDVLQPCAYRPGLVCCRLPCLPTLTSGSNAVCYHGSPPLSLSVKGFVLTPVYCTAIAVFGTGSVAVYTWRIICCSVCHCASPVCLSFWLYCESHSHWHSPLFWWSASIDFLLLTFCIAFLLVFGCCTNLFLRSAVLTTVWFQHHYF